MNENRSDKAEAPNQQPLPVKPNRKQRRTAAALARRKKPVAKKRK